MQHVLHLNLRRRVPDLGVPFPRKVVDVVRFQARLCRDERARAEQTPANTPVGMIASDYAGLVAMCDWIAIFASALIAILASDWFAMNGK